MIRMIHWNDIIIKANNAAAMYLKFINIKHLKKREKRKKENRFFRRKKKTSPSIFISMWLI